MANEIIRELEIDVARENRFQAILAKQYDKATRYILAKITNLGEAMSVDSGSAVTINFERPHTTGESASAYQAAFSGSVVGGKVKVPLPYWALERDGVVTADISIIGTDDSRLSTMSFVIQVQTAAYDGNSISEDTNCDVLTELISQVQLLNTTVTSAEETRTANEESRVSAEEARAAAETERQSNETTRQANEESRATAETERATAESDRVTEFNNIKSTAENLIDDLTGAATNAATSAESAASSATAAANSAESAANSLSELETQYNAMNVTLYVDTNGDLHIVQSKS